MENVKNERELPDSAQLQQKRVFTAASRSNRLPFFSSVPDKKKDELLEVPEIDGKQLAKPGVIARGPI